MSKEYNLLVEWKEELNELMDDMRELGDKPNTLRYELLATEALRLSRCVSDLTEVITIKPA